MVRLSKVNFNEFTLLFSSASKHEWQVWVVESKKWPHEKYWESAMTQDIILTYTCTLRVYVKAESASCNMSKMKFLMSEQIKYFYEITKKPRALNKTHRSLYQ